MEVRGIFPSHCSCCRRLEWSLTLVHDFESVAVLSLPPACGLLVIKGLLPTVAGFEAAGLSLDNRGLVAGRPHSGGVVHLHVGDLALNLASRHALAMIAC